MKTLNDIRNEVYDMISLSDGERLSYDEKFVRAVNSAIRQISPRACTLTENKYIVSLLEKEKCLTGIPAGGEDRLYFILKNVGTISFEYYGEGALEITQGGRVKKVSLDKDAGTMTLTVTGEASRMKIYSSSGIYFKNIRFVPSCGEGEMYTELDMKKEAGFRFIGFMGDVPVESADKHKIPREIIFFDNSCVRFLNDGEIYIIRYHVYPPVMTGDGNEAVLLTGPAVNALVYLVSSKLLAGDDERLSVIYFNEYSSIMDEIILNDRLNRVPSVVVTGGSL